MEKIIFFLLVSFITCSCVKRNKLYKEKDPENLKISQYLYPFHKESQNFSTEITIQTKTTIPNHANISIPYLKYNKSWLFTLTQDDCKHAAYCYTWAAINGRPISKNYYYNTRHYLNEDLPPDVYYLGKTLGSTDGAGNEVRFSFTTTLAPEWAFMNVIPNVSPEVTQNNYRFSMKSGLIWEDLAEMINYGTSIAFHDVNTNAISNIDSIVTHFEYSQDSILLHLSGRGCKMLSEPNGNKAYIIAAQKYSPIQIITAQAQTVKLYPSRVENDLQGQVINRMFSSIADTKKFIESQLSRDEKEREAVCVGVHGTGTDWVEFFLWLNDQYCKDGNDSMWFTSLEEYYEYNYYRVHSTIQKIQIDAHTLKIKIDIPTGAYFYYPSITLNLEGISQTDITSITTDNTITGLSWADYKESLMINIDCRKYLLEHATHFIEEYEKNPTFMNKCDASYFVNMLKDSPQKKALLERIE